MEQTEKVIFREEAAESIAYISYYIKERGFPENAKNFSEKLYAFGKSLAIFPEKYPICRFPKFARRNMHCAVFHKNYIFVYKVVRSQLIIFNVVHGKTIK